MANQIVNLFLGGADEAFSAPITGTLTKIVLTAFNEGAAEVPVWIGKQNLSQDTALAGAYLPIGSFPVAIQIDLPFPIAFKNEAIYLQGQTGSTFALACCYLK